MTREEAIETIRKNMPSDKSLSVYEALETLIPELRESEDEKIRKLLVWQVHRNIEDETNDLAQSVYDGIKGHDPDIEESIEDWKRCLAWLEKQKETEKEVSELFDVTDSYNKGYRAGQEKALQELKEHIKEDKTQCYSYDAGYAAGFIVGKEQGWKERGKYEKQKENLKSSDSIPSDCTSDVKCEDRWHKVSDSLPDNGRLVLANDCLGNTLLARYDGEGNWEVSVYDNEDYYCRNTITKWCEIPSEKQKEQKPKNILTDDDSLQTAYLKGQTDVLEDPEAYGLQKEQKPEWSEEDEAMRDNILRLLSCFVGTSECDSNPSLSTSYPAYQREMDWLKSLRPSWKPSKEQLTTLLRAEGIIRVHDTKELAADIAQLYEQLKKLM